ncbi:MAG: hypothetical protein WB588_01495 [Dehalococcoidia bacterium]
MSADESIKKGLLNELLALEDKLSEIYQRFKKDQAEYEIASRKYAAMRDMVTKYLGHSPYDAPEPDFGGLSIMAEDPAGGPGLYGGFRFIYIPIGKAVISALREAGEPLSLEEIVKRLQNGGVERDESSLTRAVNAALIKTKGIAKTKEGKYSYIQGEGDIEPDDIPF